MIARKFIHEVKSGMAGKNIGLPYGFPRIDSCICGLQRGYLTVIGGDTGSGKSTLALYMSVYRPLMNAFKNGLDINIIYFSLELTDINIIGKLVSTFIYEHFNVEISYKEILSFELPLSEEKYAYIEKSLEFVDYLEKHLTIYYNSKTAFEIIDDTNVWLENFGKFNEDRTVYNYHNPETHLIGVIDHIGLLSGGNKKKAIDDCVNQLIPLKGITRMSWFILQQLNRGFKSMDRRTANNGQYSMIQLNDFSDSSDVTAGADIVLAIFNAYRERQKTAKGGYDVSILKDRFRIIQILKNRNGEADKYIGMHYKGNTGFWEELPKADEVDYSLFRDNIETDEKFKYDEIYL